MGLVVKLLAIVLALALAASAIGAMLALRDADRRMQALARQSLSFTASAGAVEYAVEGEGLPVLVIHGAGGGFDQGLEIAKAYGGKGYRWIAPSRFGYLRSALPDDASTAAQADAFAELLDHLGVEKTAVLAFSGGTPPALQFAERHPDRVSRLVLLSSAPFTPYDAAGEARPIPTWAYQAAFGNDVAYWVIARLAPDMVLNAFDARPELVAAAGEDEAGFLDRLVDSFMPASKRIDGVLNEAAAIAPDVVYDLTAIAQPVLLIHARDDRINTFATAERLAAGLPQSELIALDRGGHLLLTHHTQIRAHVNTFLAESAE
jgi:2-hydroxy-6-oxonona-2,4-dienedioate hydrolase